jgi:Domain of unknown function (DUF4268)
MAEINKITRIDLKEVWRYEDRDLTPWLCDNIDVIGDTIGIQLTNASKEQSTGVFSVDIKAEDLQGNIVIIENQFGNSDHDHLGKLITYLSSFDAKTAVWIVQTPRTEHINAINWLNEGSNGCNFYLLKLEAIKIGDSQPAPLLTKIVGPSDESKNLGQVKKEDAERFNLRQYFWEKVLSKAKSKGLVSFNSISPTKDSWIAAASGKRGLQYVFWVNQSTTRIELRIDRGKGSEEENLKILNALKEHLTEIENAFGGSLQWEDLEGYRVCSVRKDFANGGYKNSTEEIEGITDILVTSMQKLENATKQFIKKLEII